MTARGPVLEGPKADKISRALAKRNKAFRKLTRREQRVKIAEDVIAQLRAGDLVPAHIYAEAKYFVPGHVTPGGLWEEDPLPKVDASLLVEQVACEVCGIGALFVAAVKQNDRLGLAAFMTTGQQEIHDYLARWFDADQLVLIEEYYEGHSGLNSKFARFERSDKKRMRMIMENIVSNGGKFDPTKGAHSGLTLRAPG